MIAVITPRRMSEQRMNSPRQRDLSNVDDVAHALVRVETIMCVYDSTLRRQTRNLTLSRSCDKQWSSSAMHLVISLQSCGSQSQPYQRKGLGVNVAPFG